MRCGCATSGALTLRRMSDRPPCDCGCANIFGAREAQDDLKRYRRDGAASTTKALIEAIVAEGIQGATLLDIGGGIGAIAFELLAAGAVRAESVDATEAYTTVSHEEAERRKIELARLYQPRLSAEFQPFLSCLPGNRCPAKVPLDERRVLADHLAARGGIERHGAERNLAVSRMPPGEGVAATRLGRRDSIL